MSDGQVITPYFQSKIEGLLRDPETSDEDKIEHLKLQYRLIENQKEMLKLQQIQIRRLLYGMGVRGGICNVTEPVSM